MTVSMYLSWWCRLGVERLSGVVESVPLFGKSWGLVDSDDDDDEGSDEGCAGVTEDQEEATLLQACLLYWLLWLPQQKLASPLGGDDVGSAGDLAWTCCIAGPGTREEAGAVCPNDLHDSHDKHQQHQQQENEGDSCSDDANYGGEIMALVAWHRSR